MQTKTSAPFYDEEDETVYGSAEYDKTENKSPTVDNTVHGHMGYPLVTPFSTIGKKRPSVNVVSSAGDPYPQVLSIVLSSLVPVISVCRRWWWWWWWETEEIQKILKKKKNWVETLIVIACHSSSRNFGNGINLILSMFYMQLLIACNDQRFKLISIKFKIVFFNATVFS